MAGSAFDCRKSAQRCSSHHMPSVWKTGKGTSRRIGRRCTSRTSFTTCEVICCHTHRTLTSFDFSQAWAEAVRQDSTVIIFNCGNYERIGIRHRTTQTLYLSQLIKTYRCKDPPYGKLHIGLYMAAFEDAVDRAAQQREAGKIKGNRPDISSDHRPLHSKRSLPNDGPACRTRKRRKLHTARPFGASSSNNSVVNMHLFLLYLKCT